MMVGQTAQLVVGDAPTIEQSPVQPSLIEAQPDSWSGHDPQILLLERLRYCGGCQSAHYSQQLFEGL